MDQRNACNRTWVSFWDIPPVFSNLNSLHENAQSYVSFYRKSAYLSIICIAARGQGPRPAFGQVKKLARLMMMGDDKDAFFFSVYQSLLVSAPMTSLLCFYPYMMFGLHVW